MFSQPHFPNLGTSKSTVFWCALALIVTLVLASCSPSSELASNADDTTTSPAVPASPTLLPTPTPISAAAEIVAQGEDVPFDMCGGASAWVRPSEERQRSEIWEFGRYAGADEEVLKYPWTHDFFVVYGTASIEQDIRDLSGLWTLPGWAMSGCFEQERHDALRNWEEAEIWVLLHKVRQIKREGTSYVVIVEPVEHGVQFVRFPRPDQRPLTLYFATEDGHEIDQIVEENYMYWPRR